MSLNRADALRRKLEEEHGFNAEQANGTMMVVDEMVDHGIDRVLKSIADLESKMDARLNVIEDRLKTIEDWLPYKSALLMIAVVAAYVAIFGT